MKCIVTITGPTASGKSTLEGLLVQQGSFYKTVSTTTREPRESEQEGKDYFFTDVTDFNERHRNDEFIEAVFFKGNGYSVSKTEIEKAFAEDKNVVVVCEPNGARQIKKYAKAHGIPILQLYITNSLATLVERFIEREFKFPLTADQIEYKSQRLSGLINEHGKWSSAHKWDLEIEWFSEVNQKHLVKVITNHAKQASSSYLAHTA